MVKSKVPVSIVTGYLGAGKTTLLKKIIKDTKKKIAILMNEFGEIGIDSKVIRGKNVDMTELLGGCVCCSLTGEMESAIKEVVKKVKPDMIVVETTGVAEPDALIELISGIKNVNLDSVITVVDADALIKFPSLGHTGRVQIENADVIILNKLDLISANEIHKVWHMLQQLNPRAQILKATYSNIDTRVLFGLEVDHAIKEHGMHETSQIDSFVYRSDRVHDRSRFSNLVSRLPADVYRVKGYVKFSDNVYFFSYVNGRFELIKSSEGEETELVFIGSEIKKFERDVIRELVECQL